MKILMTGASSFTGMWFAEELAHAGHEVTATFTRSPEEYSGTRRKRVERIKSLVHPVYNCCFGDSRFLQTIDRSIEWDIFCHHASDVTDYKSPEFNFSRALDLNTHNIGTVLKSLLKKNCNKLLLTGSVFEQREGKGTQPLNAVSPYGLSKGMTADVFSYFCSSYDFNLGKFVIPNPFGPFEEERFTSYLLTSWLAEKTPSVNTPEYIRDNIHVSLLAKAYAHFADDLIAAEGEIKSNPGQYRETQGKFTTRLSREMSFRINRKCHFKLGEQTEFFEPLERVNFDTIDPKKYNWNEEEAWNNMADYYLRIYDQTTC